MKIDRYQGWFTESCGGKINDHQINECVMVFYDNIPKDKRERLLKTCLDILNETNDLK